MRRGGIAGLIVALGIGAVAIGAGVVVARSDRSGEAVLRVENLPYWAPEDLPFRYCVHSTPTGFVSDEKFESLVADAFAAWGVPHEYTGKCPLAAERNPYEPNNFNEVLWRQLPDLGSTFWHLRCGNLCGALPDPRMLEADVLINPAPPSDFATQQCLRSVIVHEVGHALGLSHVSEDSIMASWGCDERLTNRDVRMIEARYGKDRRGERPVRDDQMTIEELLHEKTEALSRLGDAEWIPDGAVDALFSLHSPSFREACPRDEYVRDLGTWPGAVDEGPYIYDVQLIDSGESHAELAYRVAWIPADGDGEYEFRDIESDNPDRWVLIDNRWYDDVDDNTPC